MRLPRLRLLPFILAAALISASPAAAQLRGHGGPVRALAVAPDGETAISGSFDTSAILWAIDAGVALGVLRFHDGAVNAVAALPDRRFATASEDGRIALWQLGLPEPENVIEAHQGPVVSLAVSPDGRFLASASWDATARLTPLGSGEAQRLEGHKGNVNAVAFLPNGRLVTAGYDATIRIWPKRDDPGATAQVITLPSPLNALAVAKDGEIAVAGADAIVRVLRPDGSLRAAIEGAPNPIIALALSPDGTRLAAATAGGTVAVIERLSARTLFNLVGPGLPVWTLAWRPDGAEIVTGGGDRMIHRWNAATGEPIGAVAMPRPPDSLGPYRGDRGAEVFRACVACHTLSKEDGNRAGPTLAGIMGRRIATAPGYRYSEPLKKLDIIWGPRTIAELFEVGPGRYTPGTKMPEQKITRAEDREALVHFLEKATAPQ